MPVQFEPYPGIGKITRKVLRESRTAAVRILVVSLVAVFLLVYEYKRESAAWRAFEVMVAVAVAVFVYPFVEGPIRLHSRGRLALHSGYRLPPESCGPPSPEYRDSDLRHLGFDYAGQLIDPAGTRNVGIRMDLYVHQGNQDSAYLAEIISGLGATPVVSFKARFEDGFAFETNNVSNASIFKGNPDHRSFRFPQIRSTESLYRLHRRIKQDAVADHHYPIIADKQGELAEFVARAEVLHQRMAQCGDYRLSLEGDCYRPTWTGAIRQSWLLAWPVKQIRAIRLQNNSLRVARELGLPINVKLGRIYEPADEDNPSH